MNNTQFRLAIVTSHPIQYQTPLFEELARRLDLKVFFAHNASAADQARAGYGVEFSWDVDLLSGYEHAFLNNESRSPGLHHFAGCDTPGVGSALQEFGPDAVMTSGWHFKCYLQAIWAARRAGLPVMTRGDSQLETRRSMLKRVAKYGVYPVALRAFSAALYVGNRSRRYWEYYGFPPNRLFFSPHCIDTDRFRALASAAARAELRQQMGIPQHAVVALFSGRLVPNKRPLDIVAALAVLRGQGREVYLMVAGSGPLMDELVTAAAKAGVPLIMLGFCNQSKMPSVYAAADLLVLPSNGAETWGLVANEALASGLPIVVSDACGCAEDLAADGLAGRVYRVGDQDALALSIASIMDAPPSSAAIAERSTRYSIAAAAEGIEAACEYLRVESSL